MAQNWNTLLSYIKKKVGAPLNLLEITDDDIYNTVMDDVIPALSQYIGKPLWLRLTSSNLASVTSAENSNTYDIPVPTGVTLVDVVEAYYSDSSTIWDSYGEIIGILDPRDVVMSNEYNDMVNYLSTVQSFRFLYPNKISFDEELDGDAILECKAIHTDLSTIPGDIFYDIFRDWCLAEIKENILAMRSKYESLTAPFGEIRLNWQKLEQDVTTIRQKIEDKLNAIPPEHLIWFT
jgi:hypothetical protein